MKSATLQRFQLAFKHLLLLEENSRLHPIFQDFAFNFHTFSRSGKVVCKFPDFFKNSRLCTNPAYISGEGWVGGLSESGKDGGRRAKAERGAEAGRV